ncbi:MAG: lipid-A-disaccharide synthase [Bacteroidales bacterium]|nr:lipid-A-disaccharide synthase [Bacteroidales bacterium]MBQ1831687.1 lipid-A-disaccharide synthase [Bacteroidales bacterium]
MKYYIIAGEASGDLYASNLMRGLRTCDPGCEIRFRGSEAMTPVMGILEVVGKAGQVLKNLAACQKDLLAWQPDAVILIDYPGFNLRIARFAHAHGLKVFYYIAPKVWAHAGHRLRRLKRDVDVLYCIFPFEPAWFRARGLEPRYFGHPLQECLAQWPFQEIDGARIVLLPGSRSSELRFLMPRYAELERLLAADARFDRFRLFIAAAPSIPVADYRRWLPADSRIEVLPGRTYDLLAGASAAVICSGTANLEAALLGTPQVVCYGFRRLTWWIARLTVKLRFVSPVNLCLDRGAVAELLQDRASAAEMFRHLERLLFDAGVREKLQQDYTELKTLLGDARVAERIAQDIYGEIARI